jgi:hypothetical protein
MGNSSTPLSRPFCQARKKAVYAFDPTTFNHIIHFRLVSWRAGSPLKTTKPIAMAMSPSPIS